MTTPESRRRRLLALLCCALLCAPLLQAAPRPTAKKARQPYALIFGTVWGPDSYPVPGVKIKIRRADKKKPQWELVSDRRGEFAQRVPAAQAEYVIWAELPARKRKDKDKDKDRPRPEKRVQIQYDERVDISLHLSE